MGDRPSGPPPSEAAHWRGETAAASEERHRAILPATITPPPQASQTAPLSRRRRETSSVHVTTQGNKHRRHRRHHSWWATLRGAVRCGAVRCGGCKQTTGGGGSSGRTPQGWSSSGRAVFTFSLLCNCTRGLNRAERGRLHHFLSSSLPPSFVPAPHLQPATVPREAGGKGQK